MSKQENNPIRYPEHVGKARTPIMRGGESSVAAGVYALITGIEAKLQNVTKIFERQRTSSAVVEPRKS